jgi:hypothetical protein
MIATTLNSQNVWLINEQPDWQSEVKATIELLTDISTGLTNREGRRPHGSTLRFSRLSYTTLDIGEDTRKAIQALRTIQTDPVCCPLWPAVLPWVNRAAANITGGIYLVWKDDWSNWELYEAASEPSWPAANDWIAPVLMGRLDKRSLTWPDPSTAQFPIEFVEQSPAAYAISASAVAWTAGPSPSIAYASAPTIFPFTIAFDSPTHTFDVRIVREALGFGRQPVETVYPQTNPRAQDGDYVVAGGDVGKLLRWFLDYGAGGAFWASNWVSHVELTADALAADVVLHASDTDAVTAGDYIGILTSSGIVTGRVFSKTSNTITLVAAVGQAITAATDLVSHLTLCRLAKPTLSLSWVHPGLAACTVQLLEVPPEYIPASDEVLGTSLGALPTRCYLYELSRTLDGVVYTDRLTSFEADLSDGTNTYTAQKIGHGTIIQGVNLDTDQVDVSSGLWAGNPLQLQAMLKMEAPLFLVIKAANVVAGAISSPAVVFRGEVTTVSVKGSILKAKAVTGGTLFDRMIPRVVMQPACNNSLFDVGCALAKADWKFTATVQDPGTPGYPFTIWLNTLARAVGSVPTIAANWFVGGWVEFGSGLSWQRRAIIRSTIPYGGALSITLNRDPDPFPEIGDPVVLYPGCDGSIDTCRNVFGNVNNFMGHPFMPLANPSLTFTAVSAADSAGKK